MPCEVLPPFPSPPPLPPGMSIPIFPGVTIPSKGLCCKIQVPPWGTFPVPAVALPIPFPAAVMTAYAALVKALQQFNDALPIPCPNE